STPTPDQAGGVEAVFSNPNATTTNYKIDDVTVWDSSVVGTNPGGTDQDIPSQSVFDADGRPIESILPPHAVGGLPLVSATTYDPAGRADSVTIDSTQTYPALINADGFHGYWPLDDRVGGATDKSGGATLTITGGVAEGVAGGIDEARTGFRFDGTTGAAHRTSAKETSSSAFTIDAWIRPDAKPASGYALAVFNGIDSGGFGIGIDSNGYVGAYYPGAGGWTSSGVPITVGTWHEVSLTRNGTSSQLYVDGVAAGSTWT